MSWRSLLLALLLAHVLLAVARIPHAVIGKRVVEVSEIERQGDAGYLLARGGLQGGQQIEWLRAHTPERSAILFRGTRRGSMEFAAGLLWPRLLCAAESVTPDASHACGLPLERVSLEGRSGVPVLIGEGRVLRLELR